MNMFRSVWRACVPERVRKLIYRMRIAADLSVPLVAVTLATSTAVTRVTG